MLVLDTSFLVDYLDGTEPARAFLDDHGNRPAFAPTLALFETYRGAARAGGRDALERAEAALAWVESLPLSAAVAREAALLEAELLDDAVPVNRADVLVAATARHAGGVLVTADADFDRVGDLEVHHYRE